MSPFTGKLFQMVEQLAPNLPASAREVLRNALGGREASGTGQPGDGAPLLPCLAPPGRFPDLSALRSRLKPARTPRDRSPGAPAADDGAFTAHRHATPIGSRAFKLFRPANPDAPRGLVVMLHGCSQDPDDFATGTRMNKLAERHNLAVAYPEQPGTANPMRCWNWFLPDNQKRDEGEAAAIAAIAREAARLSGMGAPEGRCFVAGLSAGGAMAAILGEAYPDLFAGVGIHSGLVSRAAHDVTSAFAAMRNGASVADETGSLAAGLPTIVFHGDKDTTVHPSNADVILARVNARESGLSPRTERGQAPGGRSYSRTMGVDGRGRVRFESWTVSGAGHAWFGGSAQGTYTDPAGPDASAEMARFFLEQLADAPAPARTGAA